MRASGEGGARTAVRCDDRAARTHLGRDLMTKRRKPLRHQITRGRVEARWGARAKRVAGERRRWRAHSSTRRRLSRENAQDERSEVRPIAAMTRTQCCNACLVPASTSHQLFGHACRIQADSNEKTEGAWAFRFSSKESGWRDLNPRPFDPQSNALPSCATTRCGWAV